jgi:hypothetical protein
LEQAKVTVVHYDSNMEVGKFGLQFGGRTKDNEALKLFAETLKNEGFGRLGLGVATGERFKCKPFFVFLFFVFVFFKKKFFFFLAMLPQGFRGMTEKRMHRIWLCNRLPDSAFDSIRVNVLEKLGRDLSGQAKASSIYDANKRL